VLLIARGEHHKALSTVGLMLETPDERVTLPIPVAADPREIAFGPDDIVLLATKSQDTEAAIESLRSAAPASTPVVCLQNGVENERIVARRFSHVYGALVLAATAHLEPGSVQAYGVGLSGRIDVGRYPRGVDERCVGICAALRAARLDSEPQSDVMLLKHAKLISNLDNAVEAICGWDVAAPELVDRVQEEGRAALRAAGIPFIVDSSSTTDAPRKRRTNGEIAGRSREGGSTWQSVVRNAATVETDYLNGEIVLHGRLTGVPTPLNELLCELMREMVGATREPGWLSPEEVLARLEQTLPASRSLAASPRLRHG
jgi:2-dehydropantoate 2-reductase